MAGKAALAAIPILLESVSTNFIWLCNVFNMAIKFILNYLKKVLELEYFPLVRRQSSHLTDVLFIGHDKAVYIKRAGGKCVTVVSTWNNVPKASSDTLFSEKVCG
jgi:hypothetical protein